MNYAGLLFITSERLVVYVHALVLTQPTLVHALVTFRLDHCNSLLYSLPDYLIQRLQYVMNAAVKVITCSESLIMSHH